MRLVLVLKERIASAEANRAVRQALGDEGHEVLRELVIGDDLRAALSEDIDLLVVAGGDGTLRQAAVQSFGTGVPLAVIPLGTANNIAASLGVEGRIADVVRSWNAARRVPMDLGVARGPWGERRFMESAGAGLVAAGIAVMDAEAPHPEEGDRFEMLSKAARRFGEVLSDLRPRRCSLTLDGAEREEDLLLVEVLNTRSVGPRLTFAPAGRRDDGLFDVVTAGEEQRAELTRYLRERERDGRTAVHLPTRRAARVTLAGWDFVHLDDRILANPAGESVTLSVEPGALKMLVPSPGGADRRGSASP